MIRTVLSNAQWERIAPELPGKIGDPGRSGEFVCGRGVVGGPDRCAVARYRLHALLAVGAKSADPDFEYVLIDAALVPACPMSAPAPRARPLWERLKPQRVWKVPRRVENALSRAQLTNACEPRCTAWQMQSAALGHQRDPSDCKNK